MSIQTFYKNKVVVVTGGSMGIGKELAKQLIAVGAKVMITGRTLSKLEAVRQEFEVGEEQMLVHAGDVNDEGSNQELVNSCLSHFGKIDVLINNAGLSAFGSLDAIQLDIYKRVVDTNIYGSIVPTKVCIPALKASQGSILFVSSIAGLTGLPDYSAYSLSKMALRSLAHALRIELHRHKVFVGICYVGFTENEASKQTYTPSGELVEVPKRPSFLTFKREKTARKMLKQIEKRQYSKNQSILGHAVMFLSKILPRTTAFIMRLNYKSQA